MVKLVFNCAKPVVSSHGKNYVIAGLGFKDHKRHFVVHGFSSELEDDITKICVYYRFNDGTKNIANLGLTALIDDESLLDFRIDKMLKAFFGETNISEEVDFSPRILLIEDGRIYHREHNGIRNPGNLHNLVKIITALDFKYKKEPIWNDPYKRREFLYSK